MQVPAALTVRANHRTLVAIGSQLGGRETRPHPQVARAVVLAFGFILESCVPERGLEFTFQVLPRSHCVYTSNQLEFGLLLL